MNKRGLYRRRRMAREVGRWECRSSEDQIIALATNCLEHDCYICSRKLCVVSIDVSGMGWIPSVGIVDGEVDDVGTVVEGLQYLANLFRVHPYPK